MSKAEFKLTEVRRQALDSPIIRLSMDIRNGKRIPFGKYGDGVFKVTAGDISNLILQKTDQVLCGKNITRSQLNKRIRRVNGFDIARMPLAGERLIGLNNLPERMVFNGMQYTTERDLSEFYLKDSHLTISTLIRDDGTKALQRCLFPDDTKLQGFHNESSRSRWLKDNKIHAVDFGYAITVHKCLTEDTLIYDYDKGIIPLKDLNNGARDKEFKRFKNPPLVHNGKKFAPVDSFYYDGRSMVYRVTTKSGRHLQVTVDHKLPTIRNLSVQHCNVKSIAQGLSVGDSLVLKLGIEEDSRSEVPTFYVDTMHGARDTAILNADMAVFMGLLSGCGTYNPNEKTVRYLKKDLKTVQYFYDLCRKIFPEILDSEIRLVKGDIRNTVVIRNINFNKFITENFDVEFRRILLPKMILFSCIEMQRAYLSGLAESFTYSTKNRAFTMRLNLRCNMPFVDGVFAMMNRFGIVGKYCINNGWMSYSGKDVIKFVDEIGFAQLDFKRLYDVSLANRLFQFKGYDISNILISLLFKYCKSSSLGCDKSLRILNDRYTTDKIIEAAFLKLRSLPNFDSEITKDSSYILINDLYNRDIYLDEIVKIEKVGIKDTYCLKMQDSSYPFFLQNGFIGGNSQGSSFKKPVIFEEYLGNKFFHKKWLYTAVTRAVEKVFIVAPTDY